MCLSMCLCHNKWKVIEAMVTKHGKHDDLESWLMWNWFYFHKVDQDHTAQVSWVSC